VRVAKWYDYTSKYGLGYLLTNGAIGVSFNDGTKLVVSPSEKNVYYIVRRDTDKKEIVSIHTLQNYPGDIHKKILVYNKFKEHFKMNKVDHVEDESVIYIKKWMATKHAVLFRMNQGNLQANFKDDSVLLMNSTSKTLTFIDSKAKIHFCSMEKIGSSLNQDFVKRFKYTEQVLTQIWNAQADAQTERPEKGLNQRIEMDASGNKPCENPLGVGLTEEICH